MLAILAQDGHHGAVMEEDMVEVLGLSVILDDDVQPPYLDLTLRSGGKTFRAGIMAAETEWALSVREDGGAHLPSDGELYATQEGAILAAMLIALQVGRGDTL